MGFIIYEGEYLNGKRDGKGKEYDDTGYIIYEGEFKKGLRNGKGQEYNHRGEIIFEGDYLNGKRWNIKGYDENNNIINELKMEKDI